MINAILLTSPRLLIQPLTVNDSAFIFELVNTDGWKQFIGTGKVNSVEDAKAYVERINANANTVYWIVRLNESETPIGLVTLIKRYYLEHADIGFAFLPEYSGKGYAYEASNVVLKYITENGFTQIEAITVPQNVSSVRLLEKLGFTFEKETEVKEEKLHVYTFHKQG